MALPVCADELRKVYDAIMALSAGKQVVGITFGERQVSYSQAQLGNLQSLYRIFWRQCGADAGLPDLSATAAVERGAPARFRMI